MHNPSCGCKTNDLVLKIVMQFFWRYARIIRNPRVTMYALLNCIVMMYRTSVVSWVRGGGKVETNRVNRL